MQACANKIAVSYAMFTKQTMFAAPAEKPIRIDGHPDVRLQFGNALPDSHGGRALIFLVDTNFQRMARRPGGIPRAQALRNAHTQVLHSLGRGIPSLGNSRSAPIRATHLRPIN
jgi:hypothetical protein